MHSRKSLRQRTPTPKVKQLELEKTNKAVPATRKRKLAPAESLHYEETRKEELPQPKKFKSMSDQPKDDKIDPVEKLLCLTNMNNDILMSLELESLESHQNSSEASNDDDDDATDYDGNSPHLSLKVRNLITENLRLYYSSTCKSPMEIHNDNSSFSILNKKPQPKHSSSDPESNAFLKKQSEVPFFKNVNFNPKRTSGDSIEDYIYYDDDEESSDSATDSEHENDALLPGNLVTMPLIPNKMSFHYRHNDNFTLSLNEDHSGAKCCGDSAHDVSKILNSNSVMTGKASEMVGASRLLINDFFL